LGVLHILENGNSVTSVADLRGKTIYATGQGSTPEYVLRYVLKENGIDPDRDVTLTFVADHTELASFMAANIYSIGMLPEPNVSVVLNANSAFRAALDMTKEWEKVAGANQTLVQGVFIARKAFINEHPSLVKNFLDDYNRSQSTINNDTEKGASYIVEAGILANAGIAKKAIPGCNITFMEGNAMKSAVSKCLQVLFEAAPASIGNQIPQDDFYYFR
jgi:NitT/TauT family transport system substrate-binding protein